MGSGRITRARLCLLSLLATTALFAQPRLPDLTVVSTRVRGGRVTAVIANRGSVAPDLRATSTLFIQQDGQRPRSVNAITPALLPGKTAEITFDGIVPPGATFQVMVDSDGRVDESNEGNNRTNSESISGGPSPARPRGVSIVPELAQQHRGIRIAPLPDREPRPVAALRFPGGNVVTLIENELLLTTKNAAEAEALAARRGGKVVRKVDRPAATGRGPTYVIRVNTASAPANAITASEDGFAFSTEGARKLLAIAAHERRNGTRATVNVVTPGSGFFEKTTAEGDGNDGLSLDYMQTGGKYDVDVAGAWKALFQAGKTSTKPILIGIVDSGFNLFRPDFTELDLDVSSSFGVGPPGQPSCTPTPCPWHGQNVAEAAAGIANDGRGSTGPGAPVSKIVAIDRGGSFDSTISALFLANARGARIINMSFSGKTQLDPGPFAGALVGWLDDSNADTRWLHDEAGRLLFAAAGNDAEDVDTGNVFGESYWYHPCENEGVICVGGWHMNSSPPGAGTIPAQGLPGSNFSTGGGEVVDIWGPWCAMVGDDFANPGKLQQRCGTSFATPIVAGIAALIWAANPALTNNEVWNLMDKYAIVGGPLVRRVHAFRAVREALMTTGINTAPAAKITSSINGGVLSQAAPTTFSVNAYDVEDEACCSAVWTINGQPAGTGISLSHHFGQDSLGLKTIAVTLTDTGGKTATASVSGTLTNKAPTVSITAAPLANVLTNVIVDLRAQVMDDTNPVSLPDTSACVNVQWTSSLTPGVIATGCEPSIAFATAGSRIVTATYTDKFGLQGKDSRLVNVIAPPPSKLIGSIVLPNSGALFGASEPIAPQEQALQVEGELSKVWTLTSKSLDETKLVVLKDVNGTPAFTLADAFPSLFLSPHTEQYTLHLLLMTSSGQAFTQSVDIQQLAFIK
ncbi:MAG: serine protease [Acidobacteriota bacterium]|jgi:subtilisin family serine protease|nr:serine protease [Acidobacteriota bacterium]